MPAPVGSVVCSSQVPMQVSDAGGAPCRGAAARRGRRVCAVLREHAETSEIVAERAASPRPAAPAPRRRVRRGGAFGAASRTRRAAGQLARRPAPRPSRTSRRRPAAARGTEASAIRSSRSCGGRLQFHLASSLQPAAGHSRSAVLGRVARPVARGDWHATGPVDLEALLRVQQRRQRGEDFARGRFDHLARVAHVGRRPSTERCSQPPRPQSYAHGVSVPLKPTAE